MKRGLSRGLIRQVLQPEQRFKAAVRKIIRMREAKLMLIGPMANKKNPEITGGTVILFEQILWDLKKMNISFIAIDTNMANYAGRLAGLLKIYKSIIRYRKSVNHISMHGTVNNFLFIAPFIIIAGKVSGIPVSLRKFASGFDRVYEEGNPVKKWLIHMVLRNADALFFETRFLTAYFRKMNPQTFWFPNVRSRSDYGRKRREYRRRFVFMGHVVKEKGIDLILNSAEELDSSYTIDIYGPLLNNEYRAEELFSRNVHYNGPLTGEKVREVMTNYDVLLLPSFREGYPGVIIEAYSLGLPVVATLLDSVKEMCTDGAEGILIETGNLRQLRCAMESFNDENYQRYSEAAFKRFEEFDSEKHTENYLRIVNETII